MSNADFGLIGLAVMGENLVLNIESRGFTVAVYNRTTSKVDNFVNTRAKDKNIIGTHTLEALVENIGSPRKIMIMVKAGAAVDSVIDGLVPLLDEGDILIDGGNSHYEDTIRRTNSLKEKGLRFIGTGVSGGEEGALIGPSIMPGGDPEAWEHVKPIFQSISAKVDDGSPCCEWVGNDGAGHYVKMVHNGIEYGDMQLICEAYHLMSEGLGMSADEMHDVFDEWNKGVLDSYLIEITRDILAKKDDETGKAMVDVILDVAGQKGTGKWTSVSGLDLGIPIPQVAEAVFARCLSAIKEQRVAASKVLTGPTGKFEGDKTAFIKEIHDALYAAKICSYAQGYQLMQGAAEEFGWDLQYGEIALMWRGGCIIRAAFLENIKEAFEKDPKLENLMLDSYFQNIVAETNDSLRVVVKAAIDLGIPVPSLSSALMYYDSYRCERLPANL
ncbi:MAG: decarboxylating NADP(+)-dependent phosphogluconate dehydrogenase, partial [Lentisphaeria bacterium]|nr:decarboxylating NADP(+)-dependent phosphogluconate dehydrogenase [Lentisphaeria bacterium]NQZ68800.1 decarboxylating NADP(+)-dependent phosphogluconate dehydrogenase [Lentisphaeria bacterium]